MILLLHAVHAGIFSRFILFKKRRVSHIPLSTAPPRRHTAPSANTVPARPPRALVPCRPHGLARPPHSTPLTGGEEPAPAGEDPGPPAAERRPQGEDRPEHRRHEVGGPGRRGSRGTCHPQSASARGLEGSESVPAPHGPAPLSWELPQKRGAEATDAAGGCRSSPLEGVSGRGASWLRPGQGGPAPHPARSAVQTLRGAGCRALIRGRLGAAGKGGPQGWNVPERSRVARGSCFSVAPIPSRSPALRSPHFQGRMWRHLPPAGSTEEGRAWAPSASGRLHRPRGPSRAPGWALPVRSGRTWCPCVQARGPAGGQRTDQRLWQGKAQPGTGRPDSTACAGAAPTTVSKPPGGPPHQLPPPLPASASGFCCVHGAASTSLSGQGALGTSGGLGSAEVGCGGGPPCP